LIEILFTIFLDSRNNDDKLKSAQRNIGVMSLKFGIDKDNLPVADTWAPLSDIALARLVPSKDGKKSSITQSSARHIITNTGLDIRNIMTNRWGPVFKK